jgi:hypothetical protein
MGGSEILNGHMNRVNSLTRPFAWKTYKGCKIIGAATCNRETGDWTPKATVYWKSSNEKHLAFLTGPQDRFNDRTAAEDYAISLAVDWCDENVPGELIKAPR